MNATQYQDCPGCGLHLPAIEPYPNVHFNATPACWKLYTELAAYTVTRGDSDFIHQLAVDAYGAQHGGPETKPIGTAFALIGLHLTFERNYTGRQVQRMHMLLAQRTKVWPRFTPPAHPGALTVLDVLQAEAGDQRDAKMYEWGQSVWNAWQQEHAHVEQLFSQVMGD